MTAARDYDTARGIALMVYENLVKQATGHEAALERAFEVASVAYPDAVSEAFRHDVATSVVINVGPAVELIGKEDHQVWLRLKKQDLSWPLWGRYRQHLLTVRKLPAPVIERLDEVSDQLLGLLEDPSVRGRQFDRRGLVMGQVQSGKTTNYSALVNKALDSGYRLVVVLAGQHNNLRSQTQSRLDEEVLGFDTSLAESTAADHGRFGVGLVPGFLAPMVGSLTTSEENGDFNSARARTRVDAGGATPFVLVVKKNAAVLKRLVDYLRDHSPYSKHEPNSGRTIVPDVPLLVIDDEADQASVNTADLPVDEDGNPLDEYDPTKINRLIRELLHCFTQSAYVGYTATPFANIFIHENAPHARAGEDLFPRSFIVSLRAPENYVGPERLLGIPDGDPMPVFREVTDADGMVPDRHKKDHVPDDLAPSLEEAIQAFLLATAARRVRGQGTAHNSMLIHVTRFVAVQTQITDLVREQLTHIRRRLQYGEGSDQKTVLGELRQLWDRDFVPTTLALDGEAVIWDAIAADLPRVVDLTTVRAINGSSGDLLDYRENSETGINVIAVGGDKLSRGLTLEGLTVSYFLRASKMYDTLMQMGRWFGYRDGYVDLVRIYTTDQLYRAYAHIARATEELRQEFEYMVSIGATPRDFGLRVQAHPTMMVTSPFKMRQGERLRLSYQGDISETTLFDRSASVIGANLALSDRFVASLGPVRRRIRHNLVWTGVGADAIIDFLDQFRTHGRAPRADTKRLASFIRAQNRQDPPELADWTVALISKEAGGAAVPQFTLGGHQIGLTERVPDKDAPNNASEFTIKRLLSPSDETLDLTEQELKLAIEKTREQRLQQGKNFDPKSPPGGKAIRAARPEQRGLLLLYPLDPSKLSPPTDAVVMGLGVSFPSSYSGATIEYVVNRIWKDDEPDYELL